MRDYISAVLLSIVFIFFRFCFLIITELFRTLGITPFVNQFKLLVLQSSFIFLYYPVTECRPCQSSPEKNYLSARSHVLRICSIYFRDAIFVPRYSDNFFNTRMNNNLLFITNSEHVLVPFPFHDSFQAASPRWPRTRFVNYI